MSPRRAACVLALVLACVGCEAEPTEVLVRVRAEAGLRLDSVTVRAEFGDESVDEAVLPAEALPFTLPIGPHDGSDTVLVSVEAMGADTPLRFEARVPFSGGRTGLLDVELSASCVGDDLCGEDQTCNRCGCEDIERNALVFVEGPSVDPQAPLGSCADGGAGPNPEGGPGGGGEGGTNDAEAGTETPDGSQHAQEAGPVDGGDDGDSGSTDSQASPDDCTNRVCATALSMGDGHACFIVRSGALYCWGEASDGQLGIGEPDAMRYGIQRVGRENDWQRVSVSPKQTCGTRGAGEPWCWGDVLGGFNITVPERSGTALAEADLEAGNYWAAGLRPNGALEVWGAYPGVPPLGVWQPILPSGVSGFTDAVDSTTHLYLLDEDGALWSLIDESFTREREDVKQAVLNGAHCYLLQDDTLRCGGPNGAGQAGLGTTSANAAEEEVSVAGVTFTQISGSTWATCALDDGGSVWCWGDNVFDMMGPDASGQMLVTSPVRVADSPADDAYVQVEAGGDTVCARRESGFVDCWGGREPVLFGGSGGALRLPSQ